MGEGASGGETGTFAVLGLEHGFGLSKNFSLSIPVSAGFALTDNYHREESAGGAASGFAFFTVGLQGSYALNDWSSLNFGLTYYSTDDDVTFNSTDGGDDDFFTWNVGYSFNF